ncbi:MAG: AMP-binding protein [Firmicutes bacterium]|nr:AMP-binding protein [Bacillota bacterium]
MTRNVLSWLEASEKNCPDRAAFTDPERSLSFAEFAEAARRGGSFIASRAPQRTPVLIFMEKSVSAAVAMFSAVYAGCFYSFLEANQPPARIARIIEKLGPSLIIADDPEPLSAVIAQGFSETAQERGAAKEAGNAGAAGAACPAQAFSVPVVGFGELAESKEDSVLLAARRAASMDTDPLYVNFTSGSTGTPKGVTVCHRSVIDFIPDFTEIFGIDGTDVLANQAPFDFDVSVKDIYSGICRGAEVLLIPREYFSIPAKLMDYLADHGATNCTWAVSAMCFVSVMNGFEYRLPEKIRRVMFSGEVMPVKHLNKWKRFLPGAMYVNLYGPTEITCNCTYYILDREFEKGDVIPAGKAFPNEEVFLLDDEDRLVTGPGAEGEICVCGTCLALGYYGDLERTAEAFVQYPLEKRWPKTMYRTGDLVRIGENGELVYVSRKDFQVKHMGHRIELGEIENAAMRSDEVSRACCIYDEAKSRLYLFYTGSLEKEALAELLARDLPPFMHPSVTMRVDEMPMTKNGKIDRKALMELYAASRKAR